MSLPPRSLGLVVIETSTSTALVLCGLLGNSALLLALYRKPLLKSSTALIITALAILDLLNACTTGSVFFTSLATGKLCFSNLACQISGFFLHFLTYASMATMALTAINRFFCVLFPAVYKRTFNSHHLIAYIACLWGFVAVVVLVPIMSGWATFSFSPLMSTCNMKFANKEAEIGYTCFIVAVFVVLCLSIITFCYIRVFRFIRAHNANTVSISKQEIRLTRALFVLVFAFVTLWVPVFLAILLFRVILPSSRIPREMVLIVPYVIHVSSAVNPWIYGIMSPFVRNKVKKIFLKNRVGPENSLGASGITVVRAWERNRQSQKENVVANATLFTPKNSSF
ncbi:melatonin receptor type 1A-like [Montipora capricornis]|uniref:melatonin receptor type 1A-like n=1 Tax=Montipora capricornis TaxID=246305 RepID=UPI0035F1B24E